MFTKLLFLPIYITSQTSRHKSGLQKGCWYTLWKWSRLLSGPILCLTSLWVVFFCDWEGLWWDPTLQIRLRLSLWIYGFTILLRAQCPSSLCSSSSHSIYVPSPSFEAITPASKHLLLPGVISFPSYLSLKNNSRTSLSSPKDSEGKKVLYLVSK